MGRQRGALQVGQDPADRTAQTRLDGPSKDTFRANDDHAGNKKLGDVDVESRLRSTERGGREVDEHWCVVDKEDVAQVESSMRDPGLVQAGDLPAELVEQLVAH